MSIDQDDDSIDDTEANCLMPDPFVTALELCRIASSPKTIATALKKLRRLGRDIDAAEQKLAALTAQSEQTEAALVEREAELAARSAEIERRKTEFENLRREAHEHLRGFYDSLAQEDRRIRYRILSSANLLHGYNARLQDLPDWPAIRQMVPDLAADLPAPSAEVISENVREDWSGNIFSPSTLTRTVRGAA
jgi:hypothetical protein